MPTLKPKMTLVFSNQNTERALKAALSDRAELNRTGVSFEIEQILIEALIPTGEAERPMMRIYYGLSTVQEELSGVLGGNAAGIYERAASDGLRPLVELADWQSLRATLDCSANEVYHARSCWNSVGNMLEREAGRVELSPLDRQAREIDVREARRLEALLEPGDGRPEAKPYLDLVLRNWADLGDYTYTFRALMDVVSMASPWPDDARAREDLKAALAASFPASDRDGE